MAVARGGGGGGGGDEVCRTGLDAAILADARSRGGMLVVGRDGRRRADPSAVATVSRCPPDLGILLKGRQQNFFNIIIRIFYNVGTYVFSSTNNTRDVFKTIWAKYHV